MIPAAYSSARDTRRHRAIHAGERDRAAVAEYRAALARLRDAQAAYDALDDPRADWQHVQAACRALVIARADLHRMGVPEDAY